MGKGKIIKGTIYKSVFFSSYNSFSFYIWQMNLIRSNTLFVLSVLILFSACNESKKKQLTSAKNLYYQANKNNDYVTGLVALNEIILLDSTVGAFHDSISRIYLAQGNYKAALHFGQMVLEKKPDYQKMIELVGLSHEALGNHQNAIDKFASLYLRTGLLKYQYEIGKIELSRQNFQGVDSVMPVSYTHLTLPTICSV